MALGKLSAGIGNPCHRAGSGESGRLGQPESPAGARTTITVVPQNPKPGQNSKGWRSSKSNAATADRASRRASPPSEQNSRRQASEPKQSEQNRCHCRAGQSAAAAAK